MLNITTEIVGSEANEDRRAAKRVSLKQYVLEKLRTWINSLLEYEYRVRDANRALGFAEAGFQRLQQTPGSLSWLERFSHRRDRLLRKSRQNGAAAIQPQWPG